MAITHPAQVAVKVPRGRSRSGEIDYLALTFAELETEVRAWSGRLSSAGIRRGDRTLVMVRQGLPLIASVFAAFGLGAIPVIIDPGMGLKSFLGCVRRSHPRALIGIPLAQIIGRVFRPSFRSVRVRVTSSGRLASMLSKPGQGAPSGNREHWMEAAAGGDLAAILFTSGSTGAPKGVRYEHGMFDAQIRLIRKIYEIGPGEIDLSLLPIFALFAPALGMTTIVPEIDPRRPAEVSPEKIVRAIRQEDVTNSFGSPTLWGRIGDYCIANRTALPTLRRILCAGAPVPAALWKSSSDFLPNGKLHSPYGATEALPVATISSSEIDPGATQGACVGKAVPGMDVKVIAVSDAAIPELSDATELPIGAIGEMIVRGPVVTREYDGAPEPTKAAKIADHRNEPGAAPSTWHRTGDCGYLDAEGRLWFCGRKVERVETGAATLHTEPCEQVFRAHPRIGRCALIGVGPKGRQRPALVVEARIDNSAGCRRFARELSEYALRYAHTAAIRTFYFKPEFPVDVRHNAKIHRLALARWAATTKGYEIEPKR